jgi:hypothetical protein
MEGRANLLSMKSKEYRHGKTIDRVSPSEMLHEKFLALLGILDQYPY